jgi:hypothetical protein
MGLQWAMAYYRVVGPSYLSLLVFILNGVLLFVSKKKIEYYFSRLVNFSSSSEIPILSSCNLDTECVNKKI